MGLESADVAMARTRANRQRYDQLRARVHEVRTLLRDTVPIWLEAAELAAESYCSLSPDPEFTPELRRRYLRRVVVDLGIVQQIAPSSAELDALGKEFPGTTREQAELSCDQGKLQQRRLRGLLTWIDGFVPEAKKKLGKGAS